jgi:phosphatidylserine/phosphatidylglycerophosphate/cardiolipin synthase-like enzyme
MGSGFRQVIAHDLRLPPSPGLWQEQRTVGGYRALNNRILKTAEISTEVVKLIQDSREYCYLVTPYFKPWPLLERVLDEAKQRGHRITMIARVDDQKPYQIARLEQWQARFQFELIELSHVHMKLYVSEKAAILSSMNLLDSSQEKNYELGYLFDDQRTARSLLDDIVETELLSAPPIKVVGGWFSEEEHAARARIEELVSALSSRGYCVVCGQKWDLDRSKNPSKIRCRPCWSKARDTEGHDLRIGYCHYCGKEHHARGSAPLHVPCMTELESILKSRYYRTDRRP